MLSFPAIVNNVQTVVVEVASLVTNRRVSLECQQNRQNGTRSPSYSTRSVLFADTTVDNDKFVGYRLRSCDATFQSNGITIQIGVVSLIQIQTQCGIVRYAHMYVLHVVKLDEIRDNDIEREMTAIDNDATVVSSGNIRQSRRNELVLLERIRH